jgi:hypothetical protein
MPMTRIKVGERVRINFYFDEEVFDAIKKIALIKNLTYSEAIRNACREYVVREAPAAIESAKLIKDAGK